MYNFTVCHLVLVFWLVVPFEDFGKGIKPLTDTALVPGSVNDVTVQFVGMFVEETGVTEVQHAIAAPEDCWKYVVIIFDVSTIRIFFGLDLYIISL